METTKTIRCELRIDQTQLATILETLQRFASACNDILAIAEETRQLKLHKLVYYPTRTKYQLKANLVIRAIARVTVAFANRRARTRLFRPACMSLDVRCFSLMEPAWQVSISTISGRQKFDMALGDYQRIELAGQKPTSATLKP